LAALFSGGKDSTYAAYLMEQQGHSIEVLVSILPSDPHSWMFHTPNLHLLPLISDAMGKRLVTERSSGSEESDLSALNRALSGLDVDGVVAGAIASDYQWDRINGVCEDLNLRTFSPLWRKDQEMLLREIVDCGIKTVIVGVYAEGMEEGWLGAALDHDSIDRMKDLARERGMNISGEGGEFETLVLDSPMHSAPIEILEMDQSRTRDGGSLSVMKARLGRRG
jgi:ABC transporter with metal-binding/Fe-S-binding domain ATP-binding protein